jgi:hypothetical protein
VLIEYIDFGPPWRDGFAQIAPKRNAGGVIVFVVDLCKTGLGQGFGISDFGFMEG